jgi:hypothetical protein
VVRYQEHTALSAFYDTPDAARTGYQGRSPWLVSTRSTLPSALSNCASRRSSVAPKSFDLPAHFWHFTPWKPRMLSVSESGPLPQRAKAIHSSLTDDLNKEILKWLKKLELPPASSLSSVLTKLQRFRTALGPCRRGSCLRCQGKEWRLWLHLAQRQQSLRPRGHA